MTNLGRILTTQSPNSVLYSKEVNPGLHNFSRGVTEFRVGDSNRKDLQDSSSRRSAINEEDAIFAVHRTGEPVRAGFIDAYALDLSGANVTNVMLHQLQAMTDSLTPRDLQEGEFHLLAYECPAILAKLIQHLEYIGVSPGQIFANSTWPSITIDSEDGRFYYGSGYKGSYFPIINIGANIQEIDRADLPGLAKGYWLRESSELDLSSADIDVIALQQWSQPLEGRLPIRTLFTNDPFFLDYFSVADKRSHLATLESAYSQLKGLKNVAGHEVNLGNAIYVTLNAPMHGAPDKEITDIKIPRIGLLGWSDSGSASPRNNPFSFEDDLSEPFCVTLRAYFNSHSP